MSELFDSLVKSLNEAIDYEKAIKLMLNEEL